MEKISNRFLRGAEFVAAMMLAAIFVTFLIQIFTRYAARIAWLMPIPAVSDWMAMLQPLGWTVNLISLLWVWVVFFGCAFIVREREHVTFDVLYIAAPQGVRRILACITAIGLIAVMVCALPAMWDAVFNNRLMELKKIQTLSVPFTGEKIAIKWLFASIVLLMVVTILRSLWRLVTIYRKNPLETRLEQWPEDDSATGKNQ